MRTFISAAVLASVFGPLATTAHAADLDYDAPPPPPPPYYEPRPVPPAFVPNPVPPLVYRAPVVYPRVAYPRPYPVYGPRPVVRVYDAPRPYGEGYGRPYPPRPYGEPRYGGGYDHDRDIVRNDRERYEHEAPGREGYGREAYGREGYGREGYGRAGYGHEGYGRGDEREHDASRREREADRYGHYMSREELQHRAEREHGDGRDDHFADRGPARDLDR